MANHLPSRVRVVEVGPRDGLQNESDIIPTESKLKFIEGLVKSGLRHIEVTSFVHPRAVPQLADADELAKKLPPANGVSFLALVPNQKGLERAVAAGIREIAVFTSASETFNQKNIRMSISESLSIFRDVIRQAHGHGMRVRGYVSTGFICPYEGNIPKEKVREVSEALLEAGVYELSVGDTIGAASPRDIHETIGHLLEKIPATKLALHLHDTYGTGLANAYAGLELGITTFDSSAGGLGGCPYAPGASGNLATEDLVYMLDRMKIETGVNLDKLYEATLVMARVLGRELNSRQWKRIQSARNTSRALQAE